jgi:hypothetical protein
METGSGESEGLAMISARAVRTAVLLSAALSTVCVLSPLAAQETATDVAYVEAVSGRVVAFAHGAPALVDTLDVIGDRTRFDLLPNSELRLCHYRIQRFLTMRGPARVTVSREGIAVEAGKAIDISEETCVVAQASKFQGGFLARGVNSKN